MGLFSRNRERKQLDTSWGSNLHAKSLTWTGASLQENTSGWAGNAGLTLSNWTRASCMDTCSPTDIGIAVKHVSRRASWYDWFGPWAICG